MDGACYCDIAQKVGVRVRRHRVTLVCSERHVLLTQWRRDQRSYDGSEENGTAIGGFAYTL